MSGGQTQKPLDYTKHKNHRNTNKGGGGTGNTTTQQNGSTNNSSTGGHAPRFTTRLKPEATSHVPPIAMYILGGIGVLVGVGANIWQWVTTYSAMMFLMTPDAKHYNKSSEPLKFMIAAIIATAMQFGILLLIFKVDNKWKRDTYGNRQMNAGEAAQSYGLAFVEVVQHIDIVTAYGIISFIIDTLGDYTFVAGVLNGLDWTTTTFITFLYAAGLYCCSTIVFVRSIEYIGSGLAATAKTLLQMTKQNRNGN